MLKVRYIKKGDGSDSVCTPVPSLPTHHGNPNNRHATLCETLILNIVVSIRGTILTGLYSLYKNQLVLWLK